MCASCVWTEHWDPYLERLAPERRDVYLREDYSRLYETGDARSECFVYEDGDRLLLMPFLRRVVPGLDAETFDMESHYGYGGPISNSDDEAFLDAAFARMGDEARARGYIAGFLRFSPHLGNVALARPPLHALFERHTIGVDLRPEPEAILADQVHASHRRNIRKARKAGLTYEVDADLAHIDAFREMYTARMEQLDAADFYFFPESYFRDLRKLGDRVFLGLVRSGERIVAGGVFMIDSPWGHYHLGASLSEAFDLRPNHLLHHETLLEMRRRGARVYHLGGGNSDDLADPLFVFKRRFSPRTLDFHIGKVVFDPERYEAACAAWRRQNPEKIERFGKFLLCYRT